MINNNFLYYCTVKEKPIINVQTNGSRGIKMNSWGLLKCGFIKH